MEKDEIANLSMKKLHNELNKIKDEVINNSKIPVDIGKGILTIDNKYQEYVNNKDVQHSVKILIKLLRFLQTNWIISHSGIL